MNLQELNAALNWNLDLFFKRDISRLKIIKREHPINFKEFGDIDMFDSNYAYHPKSV